MFSPTSVSPQVESWDRLPAAWYDDERMDALFSVFKDRDVNPAHYDAKMKFWSETIVAYCEDHNLLKIDILTIASCFHRQGKTPKCFDKIFEELIKQGRFISTSDYANSQQPTSRKLWIFKKLPSLPSIWTTPKTPGDREVFIIKELVDRKAQQVIEKLHSYIFVSKLDCIFTFELLNKICRECALVDEDSNNLVIAVLRRDKHILIEDIKDVGEAKDIKGVKIAASKTSMIQPFTEIETYILILLNMVERLEKQLKESEQQIKNIIMGTDRHRENKDHELVMESERTIEILLREHECRYYDITTTIECLNTIITRTKEADSSLLINSVYSPMVEYCKELLHKNNHIQYKIGDKIDEIH